LALDILNKAGLLAGDAAQANFNAVAGHQEPLRVATALHELNKAGLLAGDVGQANFNAVAGHQDPSGVARALVTLNEAGLLTGDAAQANFNAVAGHQDPWPVASVFDLLNVAGLLTGDAAQANRNAMVRHQYPRRVVDALVSLLRANLLTGDVGQANFNAVAGHQDLSGVALALRILNEAGLLAGDAAQANFNAVAGHQDPSVLVGALVTLNEAGLLTGDAAQANFNAVGGHQNPSGVALALLTLNEAGLLTRDVGQANFNALMMHSAILCHAEMPILSVIPMHLLTQARFAALIEICQQHADNSVAGRDRVIAYINGELIRGMNEPAAGGRRLNARQSTHTASVHQSVSDSATRLMEKYGDQISGRLLDIMIQELSAWINAQPDLSLQVIKAKLCLQRLTTADYCFIDPSSQVSMKQLLALFWIAIHDDVCRQGTLDDAKIQLIDGLYESQREYNLSGTGEDNGRDVDEPSCPAGTFNKMIEKGQGVHPAMVVDFISMDGFCLKIPLVVSEVAVAYLKSRANLNLRLLMEEIKVAENANSVGPIWAKIQADVAERMFNEFGSLFRNDRTTPEFLSAIAAGEFCSLNPNHLSELDRLIGQISQDGAAAAAGVGTVPDSFFAAATSEATGNTRCAADAPRP
jgi:hypothetical protein